MLNLSVGGSEQYDEATDAFSVVGGVDIELEHSLVSLSKWEAKYQRAFLNDEEKTGEEISDYISMMIVSGSSPLDPQAAVQLMTPADVQTVLEYIKSPQTATVVTTDPSISSSTERVTSELVYYWLVAYRIPFETQYWHLNRLLALTRICNVKNSPAKKRSRAEIARSNREINQQRRAALGSSG